MNRHTSTRQRLPVRPPLGIVLAAATMLSMPAGAGEPEPQAVTAPTPAAAPAPAPPAASAPESPAAAAAPADSAASGPHKVLLLPLTFTEYQNAVSGTEAVPDWTDAARKNLGDAARETLRATGDMQLEALPELKPEEAAILQDHIAVAQLIVWAGVQHKSGEWHKHRADFDRSFGDGLRFLRERTGADYALLVDGSQVRQSGGRMAMKLLGSVALLAAGVIAVPTGGGGVDLSVCLLDLTNGTVTWFNSSRAIDIFGPAGADLREAAATRAAMTKLFASYPKIPALAD